MNKKLLPGKALLWFIVAYHVAVGVLLITAGELLGCCLIAFACMLFVIVLDSLKYQALLSIAIVLIVLRVIQRIYFADKVMEVFKVPELRYWTSCAFAALLGIGVFLFHRRLTRRAPSHV